MNKSTSTLAAIVLLIAGGCAGVPAPNQELILARSAIDEAADAEAQRYAPRELTSARRNLERAEQAVQREENLVAERLAEQARADAELAEVLARAAQAEQAARSVEQSIETLREESLRGYEDDQ